MAHKHSRQSLVTDERYLMLVDIIQTGTEKKWTLMQSVVIIVVSGMQL